MTAADGLWDTNYLDRPVTGTIGFPPTYTALSTRQLLDAFAAGPSRIRLGLADLTREHLTARPRPGKWSILEITCHLLDSEIVGWGRIRLALVEPGARCFAYDEARWAKTLSYQDTNDETLESTVSLFGALRTLTLPLFEKATPEQWANSIEHPERGPITLRNLLELYADHSERHLDQILECRRRLGCPTEIGAILPERLF